ncbi:MAG: 2-oxoglutarate dehydrogenase complex dihydrolipoyllysine-residue succinyltransferase, partial [Vicinamibacterales bacterium]
GGQGHDVIIMPSNILVPELGESIVDARVARWLKKEGERVSAGDPLVELETDKIDLEVGAPQAGVLARIDRRDGEDVKIGEVLGIIEEEARGAPAAGPSGERSETASASERGWGPASTKESKPETETAGPKEQERESDRTRATPSARRLADRHDVEISNVKGTGDAGRVMRRDVEGALGATGATGAAGATGAPGATAAPKAPIAPIAPVAPLAPGPRPSSERSEERVRMSRRRATIAKRLVEAQRTAAMLTTFNEVDMTAVMALRERRKQAFKEKHGVGLGIASFFVKGAIGALREFPRLNAEIQGDEMVLKRYYDIGIAVGAEEGLVVPVLRDADRMSFAAIELGIRDFARRANDGTLTLEDLKGGTFTITNGGVFGSLMSTPILNPPQVGILGLHKIEDRPIAVQGKVEIRPMMYVALSYDHRIVDGAEAVRFLVCVKELVEDPGTLLIES